MLAKLRVQNPNDQPIDYNGVYVRLDVMNKVFATGVSPEHGSVPRFGEAVIGVPVTVSMLRMLRQAMGALDGRPADKMVYAMSGKLSSGGFRTVRFRSQGEFRLPGSAPKPEPASQPES